MGNSYRCTTMYACTDFVSPHVTVFARNLGVSGCTKQTAAICAPKITVTLGGGACSRNGTGPTHLAVSEASDARACPGFSATAKFRNTRKAVAGQRAMAARHAVFLPAGPLHRSPNTEAVYFLQPRPKSTGLQPLLPATRTSTRVPWNGWRAQKRS